MTERNTRLTTEIGVRIGSDDTLKRDEPVADRKTDKSSPVPDAFVVESEFHYHHFHLCVSCHNITGKLS